MSDAKNPKAVVYHDSAKRTVGVTIEKRGLSRISVRVELYVKFLQLKEPVRSVMIDFSGSGARLECALNLDVDQIIDLLPGKGEPVFATARVARKHPKKPEYGIVWVQMNDDMLKGLLAKKTL